MSVLIPSQPLIVLKCTTDTIREDDVRELLLLKGALHDMPTGGYMRNKRWPMSMKLVDCVRQKK